MLTAHTETSIFTQRDKYKDNSSLSYIKNCHILSQNVEYDTFVTKNLTSRELHFLRVGISEIHL